MVLINHKSPPLSQAKHFLFHYVGKTAVLLYKTA